MMLISSAFAEDGHYIKGGIGFNTILPFKIKDEELGGKSKLMQTFPLVEVATGYRVTDKLRTEIAFDYYFLFKNIEVLQSGSTDYSLLSKTKINALFLNAYLDTFQIKNISFFLGGGLGVSFQKDNIKGYAVNNDMHYPITGATSKQINRFAYKLTAGLDFKVSESVDIEFSYNYFNLGYNKPTITEGVSNMRRRNYLVHNITVGLRYAL